MSANAQTTDELAATLRRLYTTIGGARDGALHAACFTYRVAGAASRPREGPADAAPETARRLLRRIATGEAHHGVDR